MEDATVMRKLNAYQKKISSLAPEVRHQFKIAKDTLRMSDAGAMIMGGMTKAQARDFLHDKMGWTKGAIVRYENK